MDLNDENVYNQNFSGLYCICNRPYPDPDSTLEDDMIQCIICEDWLHASHLEAIVPANEQYSEMVCKACMEKNEFLHDYSMFAVNVPTGDVDIITVNGDAKSADNNLCNGDLENEKMVNGVAEKSDKIDESIASETIDETKQANNVTTDSKSEEIGKSGNVDVIEMDLDTKSKEQEPEEHMEASKTNELGENVDDISAGTEENKNTEKNITGAQSEDNLDAMETLSEVKSEQNNEKATGDQSATTDDITDDQKDIMESTNNELEKSAQEQNIEQLINEEKGDGDKIPENITNNSEKPEQTIGDLSALTADKLASDEEKELAIKEESVDSMEQCDNSNKDSVQTNNEKLPQESKNETDESSEDKPVIEAQTTATGNIEVPDTSQPQETEEKIADDKTNSVMDAIDELLDTANEGKESQAVEQNKESSSQSTDSKENTENVSSKESSDVEMSVSESKSVDSVPKKSEENTESNNKTSTDGEMSATSPDESPVSKSKLDNNLTIDSESKDDTDKEAGDTSKAETSVDKESPKDEDEKSELIEMVNENIDQKTLNEVPKMSDETKATDTATKDISEDQVAEDKVQEKDENDSTNNNKSSTDETSNVTESTSEHKRKLSIDLTEDASSKKAKLELECMRPREMKRIYKGATFWPSNFRQKLCTCGECLSMYKDLKVLFLTDPDDTVLAYESLGKENVAGGASQYEKGMLALSSLDRIQQINALTEYNKMRDKLLDFLKSFKDRKEIVKEEDIKAFFAGMKPRREPDGVYFCR